MSILTFVMGLATLIVPGIWFRQPMGIAVGVLFLIASLFMFSSKETQKT